MTPYKPSERMRWGFGDVGLGLLLFAGAIVVAVVMFAAVPDIDPELASLILGILSYGGLAFAVIRASRSRGLRSLADDFGLRFRPIDLVTGIVAGAALKGLSVLITLGAIAITGHTPDEGNLTLSREVMWIVINGVIVTSVIAPIVEELFFRGLVFRSVRNVLLRGERASDPRAQRHAVTSAIVANSVLFMILHAWQTADATLLIAIALSTLLVGLVASMLVAVTGRLAPGIIAHVVFNGSAVVALLAGR